MAWILRIEDDLRMRTMPRDALTLVGYQVLEAATGREGLGHAEAQPPKLASEKVSSGRARYGVTTVHQRFIPTTDIVWQLKQRLEHRA